MCTLLSVLLALLTPAARCYGVQPQATLPPYTPPNPVPGYGGYTATSSNLLGSQVPGYQILPKPNVAAAPSCYVDLKCFSCNPGFSIGHGFPFERRTPVTCEECLDLCLQKQASPYPYCCRAAVYDFAYRSCDLFAVDGRSPPQVVTKYTTRSYFVPTGQCSKAAADDQKPALPTQDDQTTPVEPLCPDGQAAKFVEVVGFVDSAFRGQHTLTGYTADECQTACLENKDKEDGDQQKWPLDKACSALTVQGKTCELSSTALGRIADLRPSPGSTYLTVLCLPEKLVASCPNNFVYAPGHVLVGFAKTVVTAATERECVEQCLMSSESLGFYCKSGMYYTEGAQENCILNTESRTSQPNVYTDDESPVVYFEMGCGRGGRRLADKFRKSFSQALFDIPAQGLWTSWSGCQGPTGTSVRYRTCREKDVRNCPKEMRSCAHPSDSPSLPGKPSSAGRFPNDDLWKKRKDAPAAVNNGQ